MSNAGRQVPPIIVSPYPLLTPYDVGLRRSCGRYFSFTNAGFGLPQLDDFTNLQRRLNAVIQQAVTDAHDSDGVPVYFAGPVEQAMQPGHSLCADASWIVRVTIGNAVGGTADTPMHPDANGHLAMALAFSRWSETPGLTLGQATRAAHGTFTLLESAPVGQLSAAVGGWTTSGPVVDGRTRAPLAADCDNPLQPLPAGVRNRRRQRPVQPQGDDRSTVGASRQSRTGCSG